MIAAVLLGRTLKAILVSVALAACSRSSPSGAKSAEPSAEGVPVGAGTFAWKTPLAVRVDETIEKRGNSAEVTYMLDVCPYGKGLLTVLHRDFTFRSINGVSAEDPRLVSVARKLKPITSAIPIFVISADGRFQDVLGIELMIKRMRSLYDAEDADRIEAILRNEEAMNILKQSAAARWSAWVEAWLGIDWSQGSEQTTEAPFLQADPSGKLMLKRVSSYLGRPRPAELKLSARTTVEGEQLRQLLRGVSAASDADLSAAEIRGKLETVMEVETTWPELRPSWAHTRKSTAIEVDGERQDAVEDHVYRFDWAGSAREKGKCSP